ncbi:MAG: protein TolQ [Gammaproteobacteria bacterium]|nr:MAG: protein TolQ [Gammaproteobacteria bacterium]
MPNEPSLWALFSQASLVVQLVMLALLAASVASWAFIFGKARELSGARRAADAFEAAFWSGGALNELYEALRARGGARGGMERLFEAAYNEYLRLVRKQAPAERIAEGVQRAMRVGLMRERDRLETRLNFLATVGSTSPYVGLLGTVWGIMHAFQGLGRLQQATLATVAPAISEALVATAGGLFAAIPAVIAYNRFAEQVERLAGRYETFAEEFYTLVHRQVFARERA